MPEETGTRMQSARGIMFALLLIGKVCFAVDSCAVLAAAYGRSV